MRCCDCLRRATLVAVWLTAIFGAAALFQRSAAFDAPLASTSAEGWIPAAPRDEIRPEFSVLQHGGPAGEEALIIRADKRDGLAGFWKKTFPVTGGKSYRFSAQYLAKGVELPRRSVVVELHWRDADGKRVAADVPGVTHSIRDYKPMAETEFPAVRGTDAGGWTTMSDIYQAPSRATQLIAELHLRWTSASEVRWSNARLTETEPAPPRKVRLATVHFIPRGGKTPMGNCRLYEPFIAEAAAKQADLVVLGETITVVGLGKSYADVSEPIPGPSTEYFSALARKHNIHIVVGLVEREGHLIYNVAVLIGPDGKILGKYRKVCLPRGEIEGGLTPGRDYPVFETKLGKIGLMVCYDGFFPEVARELANRGAEVIAWPVWGCNPMLAQARACENHVYVISSTYTDSTKDWMVSAIFDHTGQMLAQGKSWGSVAVAEVDLSLHTRWASLGDFRAQLPSHRPAAIPETPRKD